MAFMEERESGGECGDCVIYSRLECLRECGADLFQIMKQYLDAFRLLANMKITGVLQIF